MLLRDRRVIDILVLNPEKDLEVSNKRQHTHPSP